jgi:hypothetical protein
MCGASSDEAPKPGSSAWQRLVSRPVPGLRGYQQFHKECRRRCNDFVHPRSWKREQIEPAAHEGSRCSDAARRHVAIDLPANPDEDDAVTGRIPVVPFDLVVRDDNLLA